MFKTKVNPEEGFIDYLGYHRMGIKQFKQSEEFLKLNVANYPGSFNAHDSLGDFYAVNGEKDKAIENYKKSISLNRESISKVKLIELENKNSINLDKLNELNR